MDFLLYLLRSVVLAFSSFSGGITDDIPEHVANPWIGIAVVVIAGGIYIGLLFLIGHLTNLGKKSIIVAFLIWLGLIGLFCALAIVIELVA